MKVLVVTPEPVDASLLRDAIGSGADEAQVRVVAPATTGSAWRFWTGDVDRAISRAESVQEETVEQLEDEGIAASGETGESDPLLAVQDALATFEADRIVLVTHASGEEDHREQDLVAHVRGRFDIPVEHRVVARAES